MVLLQLGGTVPSSALSCASPLRRDIFPAGPVVPDSLPSHDGTDVRVGVLSGRHLLVRPSWLALLTSRHRPHRFDWGFAVPPTLPTRVPGESVRVPMLPARSVLERDVVSVNDLDPSRGLPHRVLTPVQPAHSAVVRSDRDLLSVQIAFKVFEGPDYGQQLLAGRAIPLFAPLE